MKLYIYMLIMILCFVQLDVAQNGVPPERHNTMSNVFGVTLEGGMTYGLTDYSSKSINYIGKASLEYYIPSIGKGNLGFRIFGQKGFISGDGAPLAALNPSDQFTTRLDLLGGGVFYTLSLGDAVYPWIGVGLANLWFNPEDGNGNALPNNATGKYATYMLAYTGDLGLRIMVSKDVSLNLTGGAVIGTNDFMDDIQVGSNNDVALTATAGISYYFGRDRDSDNDGVPDSKDMCPNKSR